MHNGFLEELESGCPMISNIMPHETEKPMSKPLEPEQKKLASGGNKGFEVVGGNSSPRVVCGEFERVLVQKSKNTLLLDLEAAHNSDMQALRDQLKQSSELIETQRTRIKELSIRIAQRDGLVQPGRAI